MRQSASAGRISATKRRKTGSGKEWWRALFPSPKTKVNTAQVVALAREMATLLESGIPVVPALALILEQRAGTPLEPVARKLVADLSGGMGMAEAMSRQPHAFNNVFVQTVGTADRGAPVDVALRQAADFLDTADSALAQAKKALVYPALVLAIGLGVTILMMTVVLPPMTQLLANLDQELPMPTRILMFLSDFMLTQKIPILLVLALTIYFGPRYMKSERGRLEMHRLMLRLPVVSQLIIYNDVARAAGVMASLTEAGLQLPEALEVASETSSNVIIQAALVNTRKGLLAGDGLSRPLAASGIFPPTFVQTLRVAEDTGTLDKNLRRMADYYKTEAESSVKALVHLVEPMATALIAAVVGFIALAVVMPMYTALGSLG